MKVRVNAVDSGDEYKDNAYFFHPIINMSVDAYCKSGKADGTVLFICWPRRNNKDIFIDAIKHTKTELIFMISYPGEFYRYNDDGNVMSDAMHELGWEEFYYHWKSNNEYYNPAKDMISWPGIGNHTQVWTKKGTRERLDKENEKLRKK